MGFSVLSTLWWSQVEVEIWTKDSIHWRRAYGPSRPVVCHAQQQQSRQERLNEPRHWGPGFATRPNKLMTCANRRDRGMNVKLLYLYPWSIVTMPRKPMDCGMH